MSKTHDPLVIVCIKLIMRPREDMLRQVMLLGRTTKTFRAKLFYAEPLHAAPHRWTESYSMRLLSRAGSKCSSPPLFVTVALPQATSLPAHKYSCLFTTSADRPVGLGQCVEVGQRGGGGDSASECGV